jgi:hypothetical protein
LTPCHESHDIAGILHAPSATTHSRNAQLHTGPPYETASVCPLTYVSVLDRPKVPVPRKALFGRCHVVSVPDDEIRLGGVVYDAMMPIQAIRPDTS